MCKKRENVSINNSLVFMNTPITSKSEDVIGFSTYVEKLDAAISNGGQMVAITSPFGAGKTSVVELLQERYLNDPQKRVIKVSMWSNLSLLESARVSRKLKMVKEYPIIVAKQLNCTRNLFINLLVR